MDVLTPIMLVLLSCSADFDRCEESGIAGRYRTQPECIAAVPEAITTHGASLGRCVAQSHDVAIPRQEARPALGREFAGLSVPQPTDDTAVVRVTRMNEEGTRTDFVQVPRAVQ